MYTFLCKISNTNVMASNTDVMFSFISGFAPLETKSGV